MSVTEDESEHPSYVGPHEGREFDLMMSGEKHLAMFVVEQGNPVENYPDPRFDAAVAEGVFVRSSDTTEFELPNGSMVSAMTVMYARSLEEWRISALQFVQEIYFRKGPGWRPDLERMIGALLGYSDDDIEAFIERLIRLNYNVIGA